MTVAGMRLVHRAIRAIKGPFVLRELPRLTLVVAAALACATDENRGGDDAARVADSSNSCFECPPYGADCDDGVITYRYTWANACPPSECNAFSHTCALGCRQQGAREDREAERVFMLCEEASLRGAGFPCRYDVDCVSPIGATETSRLLADAGTPPGSATNAAPLVCGAHRLCEAAVGATAPADMGTPCSFESSEQRPGPSVGASDGCQSGACIVLEAGSSEGTCSVGCSADGDCPSGYACTDVLDNRYVTWGFTGHDIAPPRIKVCVPSE